jgi:cytochrome oxidase Cu insertion factor (SCO1/SenC/PrrC family)
MAGGGKLGGGGPGRRADASRRRARTGLWVGLGGAALIGALLWLALPRPGAALAAVRPTGRVGAAVGDTAPLLLVSDIQGQTLSLAGKPAVLYFMASWCSSCTYGESQLRQVQSRLGDRVNVVTVDVDPQQDTKADLSAFQSRWGGPWPHVLDMGQRLLAAFGVRSLDTTVLLNAQGTIVQVGGPEAGDALVQTLQGLLRG